MLIDLIRKGNIVEACSKFIDFFKAIKAIETEVNQLSSRVHHLENEDNAGVVGFNETEISQNKTRIATLFYYKKMEEEIEKYFSNLALPVTTLSLQEQLSLNIKGRYSFTDDKKIIDGSSALFYKVKKSDTERLVMLRVSKKQQYLDEHFTSNNKDNIKKCERIKHRNIIKILDTDLETLPQFLVLEYIDGISLDHLINRTTFSLARSISIFKQLANAIYYLHINGIVHKNIKPDKVLIDNELVPVISVFDIVGKNDKENSFFSVDQILYAPPELFKKIDKKPTYEGDQFSLGLLFYELIAGEPLFNTKEKNSHSSNSTSNVRKLVENRIKFFGNLDYREKLIDNLSIPDNIKIIIKKMLSEEPEDRYDNMRKVVLALEEISFPINEKVETALASYERCCIANSKFINDFYKLLFEKSAHSKEISAFFEKVKADKDSHRRHKMVRVAIDLVIHCSDEPEKLKHILSLDVHKGIKMGLNKTFINTIIKCVENNDPLWNNKEIKNAWKQIKIDANKIINELGDSSSK